MTEVSTTLAAWESRCKACGLSITASRRAILMGMLQSGEACDAVSWLLAAQQHYGDTSLGTVYRFLRAMEQRGLVEVEAKPHSRCRWRLKGLAPTPPAVELQTMLGQLQAFLHEMETLGLAETPNDTSKPQDILRRIDPCESKPTAPIWRLLQQIAESLGYRLVPRHSNRAY